MELYTRLFVLLLTFTLIFGLVSAAPTQETTDVDMTTRDVSLEPTQWVWQLGCLTTDTTYLTQCVTPQSNKRENTANGRVSASS